MLHPESLLLIGLVAFGVTYLLVPSVRRLALEHKWIDLPDGRRKVHMQRVPRAGGLAILFGLLAGLAVATLFTPWLSASGAGETAGLVLVLSGALAAAATGLYDDVTDLAGGMKLKLQIVAAVPLLFHTPLVEAVVTTLGGGPVAAVLAYPVVVGWTVFLMNALNLSDGLDGLAGGLALVAVVFLLGLGGLSTGSVLMSVVLIGTLVAFLRYNVYRANVFMGDTGSLLLGYLLAVLSLLALAADPAPSRLLALVVLLGVPSLDTVTAFVRRAIRHRDPFQPDREHLHHRFLRRFGGNQLSTVLAMYALAAGLGVFALLISRSDATLALLSAGSIVGLGLLLLWELDYFDRDSYETPAPQMVRRSPRPPGRPNGPRPRRPSGATLAEPAKHRAT